MGDGLKMPDKVFLVVMYVIDESDEILHVCLTEKRAIELAETESSDSDYEIGVVTMSITE